MRQLAKMWKHAVAVTAIAVVVAPAGAGAGGWAVTTLDAVPRPVAGEPVEVGFTIRQHGVSPVTVDQGDVGIEVVGPGGTTDFFAAEPDGPAGHYTATVVVPVEGEHTWSVHQGWFGEQPLGAIAAVDAGAAGSGWSTPDVAAAVLAAAAVVCALVALIDAVRIRRRRTVLQAA